ncbi:MAG: hypothetical protein NZ929_05750, partial [Aigarchaeota archaeon]|nr:hypothetical protein [Aigarchaeota archaeon]
YLREKHYTKPLAVLAFTIQVFFSKAYLLSIMLVIITLLITSLREKHYNYTVYISFLTSLVLLFYMLIYSQNMLTLAFKICNIYYILALTISTCLSIILLLDRDITNSSKIATASIPLLIGSLFFFKESYTTLIYTAILTSSFLTTYIPKSITIDRASREEVEVTIIVNKFLVFTPIIILFATSIILR